MTRTFAWTAAGCLLLAGCSETTNTITPATAETETPSSDVEAGGARGDSSAAAASATKLSPENTKIQFVGTHAKGEPNPRIGTFKKFTGEVKTNADTGALESITAEIDATTLEAEVGEKLTNHLKTEDFLDVRQHPTNTFKSTKIEKQSADTYTVTGDLTLHGTTKPIEIPATASVGEDGLDLKSEFTIDRTEFGMDRLLENVEPEVKITVTVGDSAEASDASAEN